ncbi:MAG: M16 family metallopeptidase [Terriglobia bacterium]
MMNRNHRRCQLSKQVQTGALTVLYGVALLGLLFVAALPAAAQKHYKELRYPPLKDLKLPAVERTQLLNGLVLYLVEDHTLPSVEGYVLIKTGARFEPADKVGLASIVGRVMRTGGTKTRKGEEIDRLLENMGASVETSIGTTAATASLFALKEDLPRVLEVLADLLQNPAFPEDKLELAKVQERTAIARRNDNVLGIANREFFKLLYGKQSPYARTTEYATIQNVSRDDLAGFHWRYFHPNQTILGLWGDFDSNQVRTQVERLFGSWPRREVALPPLPEVPGDRYPSVNFIQKDDVNQTNLRLGHIGGRLDDPDYYALNVMAEILGGGLSSRLFRHVRSELGLAYAVRAGWNAGYDHRGSFSVLCNTKSESTVRATQELLKEIRRITQEPVTSEELRVAKEGILNAFVFNFDTTDEIVQRLMTYEYYGYPRDFLEKFKANIEKVTAEDVLQAAGKHLKPEELVILAVGRQQDFDQPLSTLGRVNTIDITIPSPKSPPPAAIPAATPESLARGKEVLRAAIEGMGGLEALQTLRGITVPVEMVQVTPRGELAITAKSFMQLPDRLRTDIISPFGTFSMVLDGKGGWMKTAQGVQDLPPAQSEALRKLMARNLQTLLLEAQTDERRVQFLETTRVNGSEVDAIVVLDSFGEAVKLYVEKGTGRVVKSALQTTSARLGPVEQEQLFSDFRPVGKLTLPFKIVTFHNRKKVNQRTVSSYEVNVSVDPALFVREEEKEGKPE